MDDTTLSYLAQSPFGFLFYELWGDVLYDLYASPRVEALQLASSNVIWEVYLSTQH